MARNIHYPGLPNDRAHGMESRQITRYGSIRTFTPVESGTEQFLTACTVMLHGESFGGVYAPAERPACWGGDTIPDGIICLSVGVENTRDLTIVDLAQAVEQSSVAM